MVATIELDDLITAGISAGQPNRRHHSFRAGTDEAKFFNIPVVFDDQLRKLIFERCGCTETQSFFQSLGYLFPYFWMVMPQDKGPPGATEVNELISINIP